MTLACAPDLFTEAVYNDGGWSAVADALPLAPDLVFEDHRLTGFGMHRSRQAFVDFKSSTEELLSEAASGRCTSGSALGGPRGRAPGRDAGGLG